MVFGCNIINEGIPKCLHVDDVSFFRCHDTWADIRHETKVEASQKTGVSYIVLGFT